MTSPSVPADQVFVDEPGDGAVWAHGGTYKARVDARGFSYIPFFGSHAPRNFPVAFSLASVTAAGDPLALRSPAIVTRQGAALRVDHGGVVERLDLRPDGVEQSFELAALPERGAIVVRVGVETELEPTGTGIEFANEYGRVRYGRATAIDAAGARLDLESAWVDGAIEIRVPAEFVQRAHLPLVVDPLVTTFAVEVGAFDSLAPDIAFEAGQGRYLVCWERVYSATDHDVWAQEHDASGNLVASSIDTIDFTGNYWAAPRVASNRLATQFLVVAAVGLPASGTRSVWGRERESELPVSQSVQFLISTSDTSGDRLEPDVGGDPVLVGPTYYCVVWTRVFSAIDDDVHARLVQTNATLLGSSTILIDNSGATLDCRPAISKSDGPAPSILQDWNIAWDRQGPGPFFQSSIHAAQVHWDGVITSPSTLVNVVFPGSGFEPYALMRPSVSSGLDVAGTRRFGIAYEEWYPVAEPDVVLLLVDAMAPVALIPVTGEDSPDVFSDQLEPSIDTDGTQILIAYSESPTHGSANFDVYVTHYGVDASGLFHTEPRTRVAWSATREGRARLTSVRSGGGSGRAFGFVWESLALPSGPGDVAGGIYDAPQQGATLPYCSGDGSYPGSPCPCGPGVPNAGCPNSLFAGGATLSTTGTASVGADTLVLHGASMPNSTALYFQGTQLAPAAFAIDDGLGCVVGSIVRLGTKNNSANASRYPEAGNPSISVRGVVPASGGVRFYQCFYRNAAAVFCPPATSNRTNGVYVWWSP
ncbi:MAG: hypothetical protein HZA53_18895 [Planctomycetes bacterium]|nr:hypothetical protein [Planctomycetota bacterium]